MADEPVLEMNLDGASAASDTGAADPDEAALRHMAVQEARAKVGLRIFVLFSFTVCCLGVVFVFCWHLVMPEGWRWLGDADLESIKGVALTIAGGLAMSAGTALFMKEKTHPSFSPSH